MLIPPSIQWCIKGETAREYQTESGSDSEFYIMHALPGEGIKDFLRKLLISIYFSKYI